MMDTIERIAQDYSSLKYHIKYILRKLTNKCMFHVIHNKSFN